jgi:hypothetical protein
MCVLDLHTNIEPADDHYGFADWSERFGCFSPYIIEGFSDAVSNAPSLHSATVPHVPYHSIFFLRELNLHWPKIARDELRMYV